MLGRLNSIQSLGAVDGPGLRYVVFLQGCPLRCAYCHNPDTWPADGGEEIEADTLVQKALRFRPYWKNGGGVTISGGEPLYQAPFVEELFAGLHEHGVHTALDTSGVGNLAEAARVLDHTDLVLCDLKFLTKADYMKYCRGDLAQVERFLHLTAMKQVPLWIRHVVVPGLTDGVDHLRLIRDKAESLPNFEKLEFLPFHKLCIEKYDRLGIPFPLRDTPAMNDAWLKELIEKL
ncbi:pyruvate formate-lyase-activating protein [Agathobaculum sp. NTUH-O15-33]|uniref:pyruvate formate-lyase-activating protein n=1 Tax=Agathobaculum sp. NTUH-O15-33 TaxID=3079302 RepID=UPI002958AE09|nr:pyruvate formate-lyase-activating protein [Agathobaculum sp. NTUH-O15-33]WNX84539.1 pyruvate formate-lyase-activating protein [Agathobaculum sp. NTUH-O15-33]